MRRAEVTRFVPRSISCLDEFLNQLTAECVDGRALPPGTLSQLLTAAQPLWRLLLGAAEDSPQLGARLRSLLTRVLSEGVVRMRGTAKLLARELLELPYFSTTGQLAKDIAAFVEDR